MMRDEEFEIGEDDIRALCTEKVFARGAEILSDDESLEDLVRAGDDLFGACWGSDDEPYQVQAHLGVGGVLSTSCSCPYEWEGICKHCVALLLCFLHLPERFDQKPPISELLASRSREELSTLVEAMIRAEPSLLQLLDEPPRKISRTRDG